MLKIRIDDYELSATKDVKGNAYFKVNLDGQNIIHEELLGEFTRSNLIREAMILIEIYNKDHNLEWGKLS